MAARPASLCQHRTEDWLPTVHAGFGGLAGRTAKGSHLLEAEPLCTVLQDFKAFIDDDPSIRLLATKMFDEIPTRPPFDRDPTGFEPQIRSYQQMLQCINTILRKGPQWYNSDNAYAIGHVGFPIAAINAWPMGTASGYAFFTNPSVNAHWKAVLNTWKIFLGSSDSVSVLDSTTGWTSAEATQAMTDEGNNGIDKYTFSELYQCDPSAPYYGFRSWDDFFTRKFHDAVRPVAYPDENERAAGGALDPTTVIVNACESVPCSRKENVKLRDSFWLKSQPYSLAEMLNGTENARPFVGGQVYQAYLSALSYHRWHAPVSGKVVSVENVPGTYYSENYYQGFANTIDGEPRPDPLGPNNSQPYIAEVATRGIIIIEADNQSIGLMAAVFIGMCEVGSCEFYVRPGDRVTKGDAIGSFHFGGSSYCLVFRPQTKMKFEDPGPYNNEQKNKKVNSLLAVVA